MMNERKKNELTENEMENIVGGFDNNDPNYVIHNEEDFQLWMSLSWEEKEQVYALPDATSRREKMYELAKRKATSGQIYTHDGGASGSW